MPNIDVDVMEHNETAYLLNIAADACKGALLLVMALDLDFTLDDASCTMVNQCQGAGLLAK